MRPTRHPGGGPFSDCRGVPFHVAGARFALFQALLRRLDRRQACLPPAELLRQLVAATVRTKGVVVDAVLIARRILGEHLKSGQLGIVDDFCVPIIMD